MSEHYLRRRMQCVQVRADVLGDLLTGRVQVAAGLPRGAVCVRCNYDNSTDMVMAMFRHESFPEVPEGEMIPLAHVEVKSIEC